MEPRNSLLSNLKDERLKAIFFPSKEGRLQLEKVRINLQAIYRKEGTKEDFDSLIKKVEAVIRKTPEYKEWVRIRGSEEDYCQLCGIPFDETGLRKEVHHTPFTLYELVQAKIEERIKADAPIKTEEIVEDVINDHLDGNVPSLVLCPCCHKRLHYERKEFGHEVTLEEKLQKLLEEQKPNSEG